MTLILHEKNNPHKKSLPVCSVCLEPFEDWERIYVIDFKKSLELANDFRHKECLDITSASVNKLMEKDNNEYD